MRAWGNSLFGASLAASGYSFVTNHEWIGGALIVIGFLGKFISNFFTDEVDDTDTGAGGV